MQYNANTPEEYLRLLEADWRKEKLLQIRQWILRHGPELKEGIAYKMLVYGGEENIFGLNAQKGYVSLYVGDIDKIDPSKQLLKGLDTGKGCIRLKKTTDLNQTGLENFIRQAIRFSRQGRNLNC